MAISLTDKESHLCSWYLGGDATVQAKTAGARKFAVSVTDKEWANIQNRIATLEQQAKDRQSQAEIDKFVLAETEYRTKKEALN